jgi:hypothetical protein
MRELHRPFHHSYRRLRSIYRTLVYSTPVDKTGYILTLSAPLSLGHFWFALSHDLLTTKYKTKKNASNRPYYTVIRFQPLNSIGH